MTILNSLNSIIFEELENYKEKNITNKSKTNSGTPNLFTLNKFFETINFNIFRIHLFWDLTITTFLCVASSKNVIYRVQSVEALSVFV